MVTAIKRAISRRISGGADTAVTRTTEATKFTVLRQIWNARSVAGENTSKATKSVSSSCATAVKKVRLMWMRLVVGSLAIHCVTERPAGRIDGTVSGASMT